MKKYLVAGLIVWLPLMVTFWVVHFIFSFLDQTLLVLPDTWHPQYWLGWSFPGMGVLLSLGVVLLTGVLGANWLGGYLLQVWEGLLKRIPVVRSIYQGAKQVSDSVLSGNGQAFRQPLLIEYPRQGAWTIAFLTGSVGGELAQSIQYNGEVKPCVSVYVPTTPNPTSGFLLIVPTDSVIPLQMSTERALKYVISMGMMSE